MTRLTLIICAIALFICGWQVATGRGLLACVGIAGAGLLLIDMGSRPQDKEQEP